MKTSAQNYHPLSVLFHWCAAALVVVSLVSIQVGMRLPSTDQTRIVLINTHVFSGVMVFLLNLIRLSIFSTFGTPVPDGYDFHQVHAARFMHVILYGSIGFLACSGTILTVAYAAGQVILGVKIPLILTASAMGMIRDLHGLVSTAFLLFMFVHAVGSIAMHYFGKRSTLQKMSVKTELAGYITAPETEKNYLRLDVQSGQSRG